MRDSERGQIRNRERAKQLRDFTGLRWGKITPTDIDCYVEFWDRLFVFAEAKGKGLYVPFGQRLALERLCDAVAETGRIAVQLVLDHDTPPEQDVDYGRCLVRAVRYQREWKEPDNPITCREAIDKLLGMVHIPF